MTQRTIQSHLEYLYGGPVTEGIWPLLKARLDGFRQRHPRFQTQVHADSSRLSQRDAILITYGDQIRAPDRPPLRVLGDFLADHLRGVISGVHVLPFFPYSSDDGFSVIDYRQVDPNLGTWADVSRLGQHFELMFDAVVNHISRQSAWFQAFSRAEPPYSEYFITVDPATDLSMVVRPRALPLLTPVETVHGSQHVWTTFSDDQIDLDFSNPQVLLEIIDLLLFYVEKGARIIRLDAIAYLWKEIGTPSIHLLQTHRVVKLFRAVLDNVAPEVLLITETNVPHEENISYFGNGTDEAQLVYQFPLPPLIVHSLLTGSARVLAEWASGLAAPSALTSFFNFTASHDGVGVMPARGLLSESETQVLVEATLSHGGLVSYKANPDGSRSTYELNISYFDALSDPAAGEPLSIQVQRFILSQAIMLALAGVPGIYIHSILGSRSWHEGVAQTGRNRTINRQKLDRPSLEEQLADPGSVRYRVFAAYCHLLRTRAAEPAFHPNGAQQVLRLNERVFSLLRSSPDDSSCVLCLHNVSDKKQSVQLNPAALDLPSGTWRDLLTGESLAAKQGGSTLTLPPYAIHWLKV